MAIIDSTHGYDSGNASKRSSLSMPVIDRKHVGEHILFGDN